MKPFSIIIVTYKHDLTHQVISQLIKEKELADIIIVDAEGNYPSLSFGQEKCVIRPNFNCGWLRGNNIGLQFTKDKYEYHILLNNDVILSNGFISGMKNCADKYSPALFSSCYDDVWSQMHPRTQVKCKASDFTGVDESYKVGFIDGVSMAISNEFLTKVSYMDEENFGEYGWGGDLDYCVRIKQANGSIYVTESAYLNHLRGVTARETYQDYEGNAGKAMNFGMTKKWGSNWWDLVNKV